MALEASDLQAIREVVREEMDREFEKSGFLNYLKGVAARAQLKQIVLWSVFVLTLGVSIGFFGRPYWDRYRDSPEQAFKPFRLPSESKTDLKPETKETGKEQK